MSQTYSAVICQTEYLFSAPGTAIHKFMFLPTTKNLDIYDLMVSLACQSFISVFKKVTSDSLNCIDTIKRTQNFDLGILLYSSGCRVPNRAHKVPYLHSSSLATLSSLLNTK